MTFIVTIDGPAASGKTTVARLVADRLGYGLVQTGLLYRAVGCLLGRPGWSPGCAVEPWLAAITLRKIDALAAEDFASEEVARVAASAAQDPAIRERVTSLIRSQAEQLGRENMGVVVEGRDIGTAVFPMAPIKVFLDAPLGIRAARRANQTGVPVGSPAFRALLDSMAQRDLADRSRAQGPLRRPVDAIVIDEGAPPGSVADLVVARVLAARNCHPDRRPV